MDYKAMKDSELAGIMVNYINRVDHLRKMISDYIDKAGGSAIPPERIKEVYRQLKEELNEDYHYLDLVRNRTGSVLYMSVFSPSIKEAAAFGFTVPSNGRVDFKMYRAVEEALYKLTKCYSLEEWGHLL